MGWGAESAATCKIVNTIVANSGGSKAQRPRRHVFSRILLGRSARSAEAFTFSMPKVKLGSKEFDVDSEEIYASGCGVSAADCAAFAARMTTGEISRVKTLYLVGFFSCLFLFYFLRDFLFYASHPRRFTARQYHRRRGRQRDSRRHTREQQRAGTGPCEIFFQFCFCFIFCAIFSSTRLIRVVSQHDNNIGDEGASAIAGAIR